MRGDGRVFKRKGSEVFWIAYYHRGKEIRESSGTTDPEKARRFLRHRLREIGADQLGLRRFVGPAQDRVTFDVMAEDYLKDYEINRRRSRFAAEARVAHLKGFFGEWRAVAITTDAIRRYVAQRQGEKAANGTINRELVALGRMFRLAMQAGKLVAAPHIPKLEEASPRQGFFEHPEYLAIRSHLPADYADALDFGYHSGWRRGEILSLEWRDVDRAGGVIRLRPEVSKTKDGRLLVLSAPLAAVVERRWQARALGCPFIFHVAGRRIGDWRKTWLKAAEAAKLPGKLFHDLRRTVARNLVRAGVPERVAMTVTGHKTRSIFDRYNIVTESDQRQAAARLAEYVGTQAAAPAVVPLQKAAKADSR
jgi:integrase